MASIYRFPQHPAFSSLAPLQPPPSADTKHVAVRYVCCLAAPLVGVAKLCVQVRRPCSCGGPSGFRIPPKIEYEGAAPAYLDIIRQLPAPRG